MKMMKKIGGIMMALAVVLLSTMSAFAANSDVEQEVLSHDFKAYQIFSATGVDNQYLTEVEWGNMFGSQRLINSFLNDIKNSSDFKVNGTNIFANASTADDVARALTDFNDYSDIAKAFATHAYDYASVPFGGSTKTYGNGDTLSEAGYYLFEDVSAGSVINPVILKMAADSKIHIEVKASVPQVEKKVKENTYNYNYASDTIYAEQNSSVIPFYYGAGYNDAADYCIGDSIPFELIGTIPDNFEEYSTYYYAFEDTLSKGLTFTNNDKANATVSLYDVSSGKYTLVKDVTDKFDISFNKQRTGETYLSVVCNDIISAIPELSMDSLLVVNYNATLNDNAVIGYDGNINEVYLEYSNNPQTPTAKGKTPTDKVIVFTYKVDVTKYDTENNALENAEFVLLNADNEYYSPTAGTDSYWVTTEADAEILKSDRNGNFVILGLDKGTYKLREVNAPSGFKVLENDIEISVEAIILPDISNDAAQKWTTTAQDALTDFAARLISNEDNAATISVSSVGDATVYLDIVNTKVYDLPGTGGMGTTVFYIAGGVLIAAAIVLIVVKIKAKK
ncbi:MAG: isopeptide-forming domain-containing fimbrial protein [Ruminococcus sp.]|nr:isopeptide-forming domain-containing fimbrial protein [Ruminococcus sp.]